MVHRQLLAEITAGRIADDMGIGATQMVHQLGDVAYQPVEGKRAIGRWDLRAAVAAQVHPHDPVMPAERRDPGIIAARAAHCGVQQQQNRRLFPCVGEIVDAIPEPYAVARRKAVHA